MSDLLVTADSGWRVEPRYAALDVLGSSSTIMQHLSDPSYKRTISGWVIGGSESFDIGASYEGGLVVSTSGRRYQNSDGDQIWNWTVELVQES
jgi:hypothetical protein